MQVLPGVGKTSSEDHPEYLYAALNDAAKDKLKVLAETYRLDEIGKTDNRVVDGPFPISLSLRRCVAIVVLVAQDLSLEAIDSNLRIFLSVSPIDIPFGAA